jgi:hypothetical protein
MIRKKIRMLFPQDEGAVMLLWALMLPVVAGFIGMSVDVGTWYVHKRDLQSAADAAAIAGAYESTLTEKISAASYEITRNGYSSPTTSSIFSPPGSGAYVGNSSAVEVYLTEPQNLAFTKLFISGNPNVTVRAVALRQAAGEACVLALDHSVQYALQFQGNSTVSMPNCIAASNSNADISAIVSGSSILNAETLYTVGGYDVRGNAELNTTSTPITGGTALQDPYASLADPSFSGCTQTGYQAPNNSSGTPTQIYPGVYCLGSNRSFKFGSQANVHLNPGVYYVDRGSFDVSGGAQITGTGVTIILTSSTGSNYATVSVNANTSVNLSAPTSGAYSGMLMYQDRRAAASGNGNCGNNVNCLNGGTNMNLTGVIYIPNQTLSYIGGAASGGSTCTQLIARVVQFNGNVNSVLDNSGCEAAGVDPLTVPGVVKLVE